MILKNLSITPIPVKTVAGRLLHFFHPFSHNLSAFLFEWAYFISCINFASFALRFYLFFVQQWQDEKNEKSLMKKKLKFPPHCSILTFLHLKFHFFLNIYDDDAIKGEALKESNSTYATVIFMISRTLLFLSTKLVLP